MSASVVDGVDLGDLNYTSLVPYNETLPTGGNSLTQDLNVHYEVWKTSSLFKKNRLTVPLGWRYRMDAHVHSPRLADDSWSWVRTRSIL